MLPSYEGFVSFYLRCQLSSYSHHGSWKLQRCILQFFRHMRASIRSDEAPYWRGQTNEARKTLSRPAATIAVSCQLASSALQHLLESGKHFVCWYMFRHDPQCDQKGEESEYMHEQDDAFSQRKVMCEEDVESNGEQNGQEHNQCDLPLFYQSSIWIRKQYHFLQQSS